MIILDKILTDVACKFVLRVTRLCGTALLINDATGPQALSPDR